MLTHKVWRNTDWVIPGRKGVKTGFGIEYSKLVAVHEKELAQDIFPLRSTPSLLKS
jgi:hypothetical protein